LKIAALQSIQKFNCVAGRENDFTRLVDGIVDLDDQAPKKGQRLLLWGGPFTKARMRIR
jgi:hypothetical protein